MKPPESPEPPDPFSAMATSAIQLFEMKAAFVQAGFSEAQAMTVTCTILHATIVASAGNQPGGLGA